jgi:transposase-like protein
VSVRVSPTEKIKDQIGARIGALVEDGRSVTEVIEELAQLGAQLLIQTALEAEIGEFLGRDRYQRVATVEDARAGMRNGYQPITVKTTAGPVRLQRPKLRGTTEAFASRLLGAGVSKSNALESLVIAGFIRGLSVRDVEAMLAEALGAQAALSKSTVSRICQAIAEEFDAWRGRSLDLLCLDYLFLDASHFRMHPGSPATPILVAWGITTEGKPVLVALEAAAAESTEAWDEFIDGLADRGLRAPLLVISDGAAGLVGAIERNFPHSLRQRCVIHRARNLLAKVPRNAQEEVKIAYWKLFDVPDKTGPGQAAVDYVQKRIDEFVDRYHKRFPAAVRCLQDDRTALTAYLRFPREHWNRTRHSNLIERTFGETRRRAKVIGRFPGETSCVSLVWAVLDRASAGWRGLTMTSDGTRLLQDLRHQLLDRPTTSRRQREQRARQRHAKQVTAIRSETVAAAA